jgi:hypothetical protein
MRDRVYRSSSSSAAGGVCLGARVGTYKSWTQQQMDRAITAVVSEGSSIRRAALQCGVPRSSLSDRITGRVPVDATSGPAKYLSTEDEKELVIFLTRCASIGYAPTRPMTACLICVIVAVLHTDQVGCACRQNIMFGTYSVCPV